MSAAYEHSKLLVGLPPGSDYALSYGNGIWRERRESQDPLWLWVPQHGSSSTEVWAHGLDELEHNPNDGVHLIDTTPQQGEYR